MRSTVSILIVAILAVAGMTAVASAAPPAPADPLAQAATRQYRGTVVSVNRPNLTFRLRDRTRGTVTIHVTNRTRFTRITFVSLRSGLLNISASVRRSAGRWVATEVARTGRTTRERRGGDDD
jgi:hypothetical protein